ncbi:uncharacterized protein V6R79_003607 [Siganus canaliculatus]
MSPWILETTGTLKTMKTQEMAEHCGSKKSIYEQNPEVEKDKNVTFSASGIFSPSSRTKVKTLMDNDFLVEEVFSVTLALKLTLEREQNSLFWPRISVNNYDPAYFGSGTRLTVIETDLKPVPPTVEVLRPSPNECNKKKKKTLVCVASDFYPDHVKVHWEVDGFEVTKGVATDSAAWRNGTGKNYTITSRLMVNETTWHRPGRQFTCIVRFFDGGTYIEANHSVYGEEAKVKYKSPLTRERYLRVTHGAKLSYSVFIVKSCIYGAFVAFLVWKLQRSAEKQST